MEVLERLTPYVELVHLLLNTNFTYLTRKLAPSDSLDRARIPSAVAKSYDEVLFGGVLFDCVRRGVRGERHVPRAVSG